MKGQTSKTGQWQERLDRQWRALPLRDQRRYTVMMFAAYLCIAGGILAKYCIEADRKPAPITIGHIDAKSPQLQPNDQDKGQETKRQSR